MPSRRLLVALALLCAAFPARAQHAALAVRPLAFPTLAVPALSVSAAPRPSALPALDLGPSAIPSVFTLPRTEPAPVPLPRALPGAGVLPGPAERTLPEVRTGDLLFLDFGRGPYYDAVAGPTLEQFGVTGPRLHHSGIVEVVDGEAFVWEAWPMRGVQRVPLTLFLSRVRRGEGEPEGYYVGRLRPGLRSLGVEAARRAAALVGTPFGTDLSWESRELYCSKFIAVLFASEGFFAPHPMTFGRPGTPERAFWDDFFARRGLPVPEGLPGQSPLGLYLEGKERLFLP